MDKWIPMTTRPMTDEEREYHREQLEYVDDAVIFNCPLPDDGQEVLITVYGETELDTFYNDSIDGCYFENRDIEDVRAWMPLPKPYEPQESEIHCNCTDAEIAKSFIEDVEAVKELLPQESDHKCHTCKHYTSGERDGSCGSYICKNYSDWESEDKE